MFWKERNDGSKKKTLLEINSTNSKMSQIFQNNFNIISSCLKVVISVLKKWYICSAVTIEISLHSCHTDVPSGRSLERRSMSIQRRA